jgi:hypothetical protein
VEAYTVHRAVGVAGNMALSSCIAASREKASKVRTRIAEYYAIGLDRQQCIIILPT